MTSEDKAWNDAIEAFQKRLDRYFRNHQYEIHHASLTYHIREVANDLKRGEPNEKN